MPWLRRSRLQVFLFKLTWTKSRQSYCTTPRVGISKKFNVKVFYVMGKALAGKLSCPCDRSCLVLCLRNVGRGFPMNIPVKLFQNLYTSLAEVILSFFLFETLAAILFNGEERFEQFW